VVVVVWVALAVGRLVLIGVERAASRCKRGRSRRSGPLGVAVVALRSNGVAAAGRCGRETGRAGRRRRRRRRRRAASRRSLRRSRTPPGGRGRRRRAERRAYQRAGRCRRRVHAAIRTSVNGLRIEPLTWKARRVVGVVGAAGAWPCLRWTHRLTSARRASAKRGQAEGANGLAGTCLQSGEGGLLCARVSQDRVVSSSHLITRSQLFPALPRSERNLRVASGFYEHSPTLRIV